MDIAVMCNAGAIVGIDDDACIVKIKFGNSKEPLPENLSIGPPHPINSKVIRSAIYRYADHMLETPEITHAATELLVRNIPRIQCKKAGEVIISCDDLQADALEAIGLENSYLFIQEPPGAGKTYTSSHIIVDLMMKTWKKNRSHLQLAQGHP